MPIYEYKCNKCGVFEAIQGIKEAPLKKCPTCRSKVERQMSRGSFILKGSGWYATDYAKSKPSSTESDSSATTNGATANDSSSKTTESKTTESTASSSESKPTKSKSSSEKSVAAKAAD